MLDLTLARMRQIRDVVWTRRKEDHRELIDIHERSTRAIMQAVQGAAGNRAGIKAAAGWEMYPGSRTARQGPQLPDFEETSRGVGDMFGSAKPAFDWSEVEAMAQELKAT